MTRSNRYFAIAIALMGLAVVPVGGWIAWEVLGGGQASGTNYASVTHEEPQQPQTQEPDSEGRVDAPPGMYPRGTRVGIEVIDSIIDAAERMDHASIASRVSLGKWPCSAAGDNEHPACPVGIADGSVVEALPFGCDGFRIGVASVRESLRRWLLLDRYVYGVWRDQGAGGGGSDGYTLVMGVDIDTAPARALHISDEGDLTSMLGCGGPAEIVPTAGATTILAPPRPQPPTSPLEGVSNVLSTLTSVWWGLLTGVTGEGSVCDTCNEVLEPAPVIRTIAASCADPGDKYYLPAVHETDGYSDETHGGAWETLSNICEAAVNAMRSGERTDAEWLEVAAILKEMARPLHEAGDSPESNPFYKSH